MLRPIERLLNIGLIQRHRLQIRRLDVLLREYDSSVLAAMDTMHPSFHLIDQRVTTRFASFVQPPVGNHQVRPDSVKLFDPVAALQFAFLTNHVRLLLHHYPYEAIGLVPSTRSLSDSACLRSFEAGLPMDERPRR